MRVLALAVAAICLSGCESRRDDRELREATIPRQSATDAERPEPARSSVPTLHPGAPPGIAWFDGGVDAAFERARAESKPVLLYWGAEWCPYCADLEAYVFSRRDFQEKLELFVPVYLDGDDPGAQKRADAFGVAGYPTVLALGPDRAELARIAGGMDVSVYTGVLDLVLSDVRPLDDLLASIGAGSGALSADDCRRLAYNGWGLDDSPAPDGVDFAAALAHAAARCPADASVERARLTAFAASYATDAEIDAITRGREASDPLVALVSGVRAIVADRALAVTVADALQYLDADFFRVAHRSAPERSARLRDDWSAAMDAVADDDRYTEGDRLLAVRSKLAALEALDPAGAIPADLAAEAKRRVDEALARAQGTPAMTGAVNAAVNLLVTLDDPERAYEIAERAMATSKTPYYQMADLAWLDEQMGRTEAAITWLERAYRQSSGAATRFQWGTNYVRGLIRMRPEDEAGVRDAATAVLAELDGPNRLYQRTLARLGALDESLREWSAGGEHADTIAAIRARMNEICGRIPADEPAAIESCRAFLAPGGP